GRPRAREMRASARQAANWFGSWISLPGRVRRERRPRRSRAALELHLEREGVLDLLDGVFRRDLTSGQFSGHVVDDATNIGAEILIQIVLVPGCLGLLGCSFGHGRVL